MYTLFDERNAIWIKTLKVTVLVVFCLLALSAFVFGISDMNCGFVDADIIGDDGLGDFLIWFVIFGVPAFLEVSVGMLLVDFFANVQEIRRKICGDQ